MIAPGTPHDGSDNGKGRKHDQDAQLVVGDGGILMVPWRLVSHPKQRKFLIEYLKCGSTRAASAACGWKKNTNHYYWLSTDEKYKKAFQLCQDCVGQLLEDCLLDRALNGVVEDVYGGVGDGMTGIVGQRIRYDNRLGIDMLNRVKPVNVKQGGNTQVNINNHNHVNNDVNGVQVVHDANWYGNEDRLPPETT